MYEKSLANIVFGGLGRAASILGRCAENKEERKMRKQTKRLVAGVMAGLLMLQSPNIAFADSEKVVTLGADLTTEQRSEMLQYFGVSENDVTIVEVNNQEEHDYLKGIATEAEIGRHTYSCAYIMPTDTGKINVKTAHLTWVSTSMIANTLVTAGIDSCDVIAAAPKDVSGTGALTGVIKAYEKVTDEKLDKDKTELAMQELYTTAEIGQDVGKDEASAVMNEVKTQVLKDGLTDQDKIEDVVNDVASYYKVNLTPEQVSQVSKLMSQIGQQDYNYKEIKGTMEGLQDKLVDNIDGVKESFLDKTEGGSGFFAAIGNFFAGIFKAIGNFFAGLFGGGSKGDSNSQDSILDNVDDSALGITATDDPNGKGVQTTEAPTEKPEDTATSEVTATEDAGVTEDSFTVDQDTNKVEKSETSATEESVEQ